MRVLQTLRKLLAPLEPTPLFLHFLQFACERQRVFWRRANGSPPPWTEDEVISSYRFTNTYRVLDRVSQYLVSNIINVPNGASFETLFSRIYLFKIFNKIGTWEELHSRYGEIDASTFRPTELCAKLNDCRSAGLKLYSGAYILPSAQRAVGGTSKHEGHVLLLARMLDEGLPAKILNSQSLQELYETLLQVPSLGPFLAFQIAIDINYLEVMPHLENSFVVAGPGALDGISKCFTNYRILSPEELIMLLTEHLEECFDVAGQCFDYLPGRKLMPIDVQNIFCETSKYTRVSAPHVDGVAKRTRIKRKYTPSMFASPLRWELPRKWQSGKASSKL